CPCCRSMWAYRRFPGRKETIRLAEPLFGPGCPVARPVAMAFPPQFRLQARLGHLKRIRPISGEARWAFIMEFERMGGRPAPRHGSAFERSGTRPVRGRLI